MWDVLAGRVDPGAGRDPRAEVRDPRDLDAATRADFVSAWEAQDSWLEAQKLDALDAMSAPEPVVNVDDPTDRGFARVPERVATEQARLALGCSPGWAQQRVWFAAHPRQPAPAHRGRCWRRGGSQGYQALIAAGESQRLTDAECLVFERRVYPRGESQTPAKFRRACRLVAAALHPEHLETAHEAGEETDRRHEVGRGRRDGVPAVARPSAGDHRDLGQS